MSDSERFTFKVPVEDTLQSILSALSKIQGLTEYTDEHREVLGQVEADLWYLFEEEQS